MSHGHLNQRHLFGASAAGVLLTLIIGINIVFRLNAPDYGDDYELMAQYAATVGQTVVTAMGVLLVGMVIAGMIAYVLGRKKGAGNAFTAVLFSIIVAVCTTCSFSAYEYFILPALFLSGTLFCHFFRWQKLRVEFSWMLLVSLGATAVMKLYIMWG